jgi:uncharacterized membrane protein YhaH (DUF805 family)
MRHFFSFRGRIGRASWWSAVLAVELLAFLVGCLPGLACVVILPLWYGKFALTARRLHDANFSGKWQLLGLLALPAALCQKSF